MRPNFLLGGLLLLLTLAPAAGQACTPTTSDPEIDTRETPMGRFYVDNDLCQIEDPPHGCLFSIWTYQESNGLDGLQRHDEGHDDTCGGQIESDALPCQILPVALLGWRRRSERSSGATVAGVAMLGVVGMAFAPTAEAC